jgi:hypothetical protein
MEDNLKDVETLVAKRRRFEFALAQVLRRG